MPLCPASAPLLMEPPASSPSAASGTAGRTMPPANRPPLKPPPRLTPPEAYPAGVEVDGVPPIVLDIGHHCVKIGFAGDRPSAIFSALFASPAGRGVIIGWGARDVVFSPQDLYRHRTVINLHRPMERGKPLDASLISRLLTHAFYNELRAAPEEHVILLVERAGTTLAERELIAKLMFEDQTVPGYLPLHEAVLAMFASGRTTGLALCSGASATHAVPVYEGHALLHAATHVPLGGSHVTDALRSALQPDSGLSDRIGELDEIKHALAYVSLDYAHQAAHTAGDILHTVPAWFTIAAHDVRIPRRACFECAEILFQPRGALRGVHYAVQEAIEKCDPDLRAIMWDNIVLTGGNTALNGFVDRLWTQLRQLAPPDVSVRVIASPDRQILAWQGGSILVTTPTTPHMWLLKTDYDDGREKKAIQRLH